jgi:hypothetical protein
MRLIGTAHTCVHHSGIPRIQTDVRMLTRYEMIKAQSLCVVDQLLTGFHDTGPINQSLSRKVCSRLKRFLSLKCRMGLELEKKLFYKNVVSIQSLKV